MQNHSIYAKYKSYTRVSQEQYCKKLELVKNFQGRPGCVVECGAWRGGMAAGLAEVLGPKRKYYLFDSFEGLPKAVDIDGTKAMEWQESSLLDNCATDESFAHTAMKLSEVPEFEIVKGWVSDTLQGFRDEIAILHLDVDWYSSTAECFNALYEQVVVGGLIIIDDYYTWDGCSRAVHDFLSANKLPDRIMQYEGVCYLVKRKNLSVTEIDPHPLYVEVDLLEDRLRMLGYIE